MIFSTFSRLPRIDHETDKMPLRRLSLKRPISPLAHRYLSQFNRKIVFKFKDSKIVKSPKDNRHIRWTMADDLRNEVIRAFKEVNDPMKKSKEKHRFSFKMITPSCVVGKKSDEPTTHHPESPTAYDDVEVIVTTDDSRTYLVEIKTNEQGVHRNHTGMESKMMFCKTIAAFYKNQEKADCKVDLIRRGSAPV